MEEFEIWVPSASSCLEAMLESFESYRIWYKSAFSCTGMLDVATTGVSLLWEGVPGLKDVVLFHLGTSIAEYPGEPHQDKNAHCI